MIHHVVGLFTHPDQEWREIRGDKEESIGHMYLTHTLILAAIPAVSAFIGTTQVRHDGHPQRTFLGQHDRARLPMTQPTWVVPIKADTAGIAARISV